MPKDVYVIKKKVLLEGYEEIFNQIYSDCSYTFYYKIKLALETARNIATATYFYNNYKYVAYDVNAYQNSTYFDCILTLKLFNDSKLIENLKKEGYEILSEKNFRNKE